MSRPMISAHKGTGARRMSIVNFKMGEFLIKHKAGNITQKELANETLIILAHEKPRKKTLISF